jgi:hypothetical protein
MQPNRSFRAMKTPRKRIRATRTLCAVLGALLTQSWSTFAQSIDSQSPWQRGMGEGFRRGAQSWTFSAGSAYGLQAVGSKQSHDMILGSVNYGLMLDNTIGPGHWFAGNFEFQGQFYTAGQLTPSKEWIVGFTPLLRYNFAIGMRWVPFIDGGVGVAATSIRGPDLGGPLQFNIHGGVGVQRFLTDNTALTFETNYSHWSSANIYTTNLGVNCVTAMAGVSFYF